jgi:hypothetical protein
MSNSLRTFTTARAGGRRLVLLLVSFAAVVDPSAARAAMVRVQAPEGCPEASGIVEQVDGLLGRPLASIQGVEFEVEITEGAQRRWQLRLETVEGASATRHARELSAATCGELADAAALAITVSIKSLLDSTGSPRAPDPSAAPPVTAAPTSPRVVPTRTAGTSRREEDVGATPTTRRRTLQVAAQGDEGAMPDFAFGLGLEGALRTGPLRLAALAALFPSQERRLAGAVGGRFQLALVGALACGVAEVGQVGLLACGGGEIGRLSGEGVGVSSPRAQSTLWAAGRAEVGLVLALGPHLAAVLRAGVAVPIFRPTFLLDGSVQVHEARSVTARGALGIEASF